MFVAARTEADRGNIGGYYHASDVAVRSVSNRTTIGSEKPSQRSEREARNLEKQAAEARGVSVAERDTAFALGVGAGLAALAGAEKPAAVLGIGAAGAAEASGMASEKADQLEKQAQEKRSQAAQQKASEDAAAAAKAAEAQSKNQEARRQLGPGGDRPSRGNDYGGRASEERPGLHDVVSRTA